MRRLVILALFVLLLATPINAIEFTAPQAPDAAQKYISDETDSFADGLSYILRTAVSELMPEIKNAVSNCVTLTFVSMLVGVMQALSPKISPLTELIGVAGIALVLTKQANTFIELGIGSIQQLSQYGKVLIPVMTSALAAQGGITSASAIYTATVVFDAVLSAVISRFMVPLIYVFLCLCISNCICQNNLIHELRKFIKWILTWILKLSLYLFTGFITITGVISGSADSSAIKATKIALSGMVPVVGGIISDASETVLLSVGVMKNTAGVFGVLVFIGLVISPFMRIAVQHIVLKITSAFCSIFHAKRCMDLIDDYSYVMALLLAMTGTMCLLHLISTVCFMKGVA